MSLLAPPKRVAVLITGRVHEREVPLALKTYKALGEIYVSTENADTARKYSKHVLEMSRKEYEGISTTVIVQWLHLHKLIKHFKKELLKYDVILKSRSDAVYERPIRPSDFAHVAPGRFYMEADRVFYAEAKTFIDVMESFYPYIPTLTAVNKLPLPVDYRNVIESFDAIAKYGNVRPSNMVGRTHVGDVHVSQLRPWVKHDVQYDFRFDHVVYPKKAFVPGDQKATIANLRKMSDAELRGCVELGPIHYQSSIDRLDTEIWESERHFVSHVLRFVPIYPYSIPFKILLVREK
jgi:hypothetical protein